MCKLLIIDDEVWISKGIMVIIKKHQIPFSRIFEAKNGEQAMSIINTEKPDIVITDIRMPGMSGIDILKESKRIYPEINFIMISGYAEFEYAQQAINMGAKAYILKPINDDTLISTLDNILMEIKQNNETKEMINKSNTLKLDNEKYKFENMINKIFHNSNCKGNKSEMLLNDSDCKSKYILILVQITNANYNDDIRKQAIDILTNTENRYNTWIVNDLRDSKQIFVIMNYAEDVLKNKYTEYINEIQNKLANEPDILTTFAVSGIEDSVNRMLYKQCMKAFMFRLVCKDKKIYKYDEIKKFEDKKIVIPNRDFELLNKCIEEGDIKNAKNILQKLLLHEVTLDSSIEYLRILYLKCISMIFDICNKKEIDINDVTSYDLLDGDMFNNFNDKKEILDNLLACIEKIVELKKNDFCNAKSIVCKIKKYIDKNYGEELTLEVLAHKFLMNPNYLSNTFSKETGQTITKYISQVRINKACELLEKTTISISNIAYSVGYNDIQYFHRVFKKDKNMTPAEYRNNLNSIN